ncbi:MAG: hypothetical protein DKINENOH_00850 [bacterium]|nr:hypothetical protein [bacterium]
MNRTNRKGVFAMLAFLALGTYAYAQGSRSLAKSADLIVQTELRYWDSSATYNGYTLFAGRGISYLIDMEGYVVKKWNIGTNPRFLDNGNLLDASKADPSGFSGFTELDWNGNVVWQYTETRSNYAPHHDWVRIFNKKLNAYTTLYIANKTVPADQALAAGCNPANGPYTGAQMDAIVEVDMNKNIVWEWWFFDHVIQDFDSTKANHVGTGKTIADYPGRININMPGRPLRKDWLHCNSIDYNDTLDQIVINSVQGEFYVIDHGTTFIAGNPAGSITLAASSAGDFLYRFGDPARYDQGNPPAILEDWTSSTTGHKQIGGSHDVHWIKPGLPGAGNILIFNNGQYLFERTPQSYIFEVNPYYDAKQSDTGQYVNPPQAGYYTLPPSNKDTHKQNKLISNQVVWIYNSKSNLNFFSHIGSSAQRLPNGNTLICSDTDGTFFEVTYGDAGNDPKVLWQYVNPVTADGIKEVIPDNYPMYNSVFRAYRYTTDHPALQGKSLTRLGTITGRTPQYLKPDDLVSTVSSTTKQIASGYILAQNHPNPFNPNTAISFSLPATEHVTLKIYDALGREVATLLDERLHAGEHAVRFEATDLPSGVYVYLLTAGHFTQARKAILLK